MSGEIEHIAEVVSGVEGMCLYIDGYRVSGPKPWGGGRVVHRFKIANKDLKAAEKHRRTMSPDRKKPAKKKRPAKPEGE